MVFEFSRARQLVASKSQVAGACSVRLRYVLGTSTRAFVVERFVVDEDADAFLMVYSSLIISWKERGEVGYHLLAGWRSWPLASPPPAVYKRDVDVAVFGLSLAQTH